MAKTRQNQMIAIAWYDSIQWDLLIQVATDRPELDDTFEDWQANALQAEREIQAAGHAVARVSVDVAKLEAWCHDKHLTNSSSARAQYVAHISSSAARGEA